MNYHQIALEIRTNKLPKKHPDLAESYKKIGCIYSKIGETALALDNLYHASEMGAKGIWDLIDEILYN